MSYRLLILPFDLSLAVVYCQLWKSQVGPEAQQVRDAIAGSSKALSLATMFPQAVEGRLRSRLICL